MDREVPSHFFNEFFLFSTIYRMYFVVKCPSKNVCLPVPFNASGIPVPYSYYTSEDYLALGQKVLSRSEMIYDLRVIFPSCRKKRNFSLKDYTGIFLKRRCFMRN